MVFRSSFYCLVLFLSLTFSSFSQQSIAFENSLIHFNQGREYFEAANYVAAREEFANYLSRQSDGQKNEVILAEYYQVLCSLYLNQPEIDVLGYHFNLNNPNSPQSNLLFRKMGLYFYDIANYAKSIRYLENSSLGNVEARYKLGVAYFETKDFDNALALFNEVKTDPDEEYAFSAAYYAGVIQYQQKNYLNAIADFKKSNGHSKYRKDLPYWLISSYQQTAQWDELLKYAEPIISTHPDLALLVAEVQFKKGLYAKSAKSFDDYLKEHKNEAASYKKGYALYSVDKYEEAIKAISGLLKQDSLGQKAYYLQGLAYLKLGKKTEAAASFTQSGALAFDPSQQEEAQFKSISISVDLGKWSESLLAIERFGKTYPKSSFTAAYQSFASDAILKLPALKPATTLIKSGIPVSEEMKVAYQTLTFNVGIKAYNQEQYKEAITYFDLAIAQAANQNLTDEASFGKAECLSQLKDFEAAIQIYKPLLSGKHSSDFLQRNRIGIAYAYFSVKEFTNANTYFKTYVDQLKANPTGKANANALLRLADTYLVAKNYSEALTYYNQAIENIKTEKDYALYQKGITLVYLERDIEAKATFQLLKKSYPNTKFGDDASFQENLISFRTGKYQEAIDGFTELINNQPNSPYYAESILKRAQSYSNAKQPEKAITDYKIVIEKYAKEAFAKDAVAGLQEELNGVGRPEEMTAYLSMYQNGNLNEEEKTDLEYQAAKGIYLGEKYDKAIEPLKNFVAHFPADERVSEVTYLIADAANRSNNKVVAFEFYKKVIEQNVHPSLNSVIAKVADIEFDSAAYTPAIGHYRLLKEKGVDSTVIQRANKRILESYLKLGELDSALIAYQEFQASAGKEAESVEQAALLYLDIIQLNNTKGNYATSNEMILDKFRNEFAEVSDATLGKAYLLLAKNLFELKNLAQTRATLKSIIDNSEDKESVEAAKALLKTYFPK
ncbi:tetratricopeptide repeat protein [Aquirufa novilacunae]|uniref:Tetratricopeptide repeat protein n=1 Tax=Aquirufa novilacunae TaxID=3139305 RepID=A0ABW8U1B7_9BACT